MALLITLIKIPTLPFYEVLLALFKKKIFVNVFPPWKRHLLWFTRLMMTVFVNIWRFFYDFELYNRSVRTPATIMCWRTSWKATIALFYTVLVRFGNFRVFWRTGNCGKPPWKREKTCWYILRLYSQDDFRDQKITLFACYLISCKTIDKQ